MRNIQRIFISFICFLIIILAFFPTLPTHATPYETNFDVLSDAVYFVNTDTGRVVYEKNAYKKIYPASITKIMTAIIMLENIDDLENETITVTKDALSPLQALPYSISNAGLQTGETFRAIDLLYCIVIASAGDAANTVATHIGGSVSKFSDMMNEKAKELGMVNTNFTNPHGLHEDEHYTTAYDIYLMSEYARTFEESDLLADVMASANYTFTTNLRPNPDNNYIANTNKLIIKGTETYNSSVKGMKTGTTNEGGSCLVSIASENDYNYLLVLMGSPLYVLDENGQTTEEMYTPRLSFTESNNFYKWAFSNFSIKTLVNKNGLVTDIPVKLSDVDFLQLRIEEDYKEIVPTAYDVESIYKKYNIPEYINAPVEEGDFIGTMDIYISGDMVGSINLYANQSIERSKAQYYTEVTKKTILSNKFMLAIILMLISLAIFVLIISIINRRIKANKIKKKERPIDFSRH